ncbi:MAG: phosphonate C-P lyase system protein PhnH, partial [Thalassobaculaceae bacterium]
IILETEKLENLGVNLRGPGIKTSIELTIPDKELLHFNQSLYPMGLDFFLCCNDKLSGLPRSTRLVET